MSEVRPLKKPKYDGRSKKRKWEERRSDYVATGNAEAVDEKKVKDESFERVKRRKFVLLLGYSGEEYLGMQRYKLFLLHNFSRLYMEFSFVSETLDAKL